MLVNLREFYKAVTGESYKGNTSKAMRALVRWDVPMVIPDNLPNGARKHRRVDIAHVEKAKAAYLHEKAAEERAAKGVTETRLPAAMVLKKPRPEPGPYTPYPPGPGQQQEPKHNLGSFNNMRAQISRIEAKLDALLKLWGDQP